jgi:excalibur calcium-binding domain-containing protein/uncharacterized protein DUF732
MGVDVRALALLLVGVATLTVGCGSPAVTNTAAESVVSTNALPLSEAEYAFVDQLKDARLDPDVEARTLVGYGRTACDAVNSGGVDAAVAAVRAAGAFDETEARAVVAAATEHLCPGTSATASTTPPTTTTSAGVAAGAGAGAGAGVPRRPVAPRTTTATRTPVPATTARTTTLTSKPTTKATKTTETTEDSSGGGGSYFKNCAAARAAGAAPIRSGQPGYRVGLDSNEDGVACEN